MPFTGYKRFKGFRWFVCQSLRRLIKLSAVVIIKDIFSILGLRKLMPVRASKYCSQRLRIAFLFAL